MSRNNQGLTTSLVGGIVGAMICFKILFFPGCAKTGQDRAVLEITQVGGHVQIDNTSLEKPVVRIDFEGPLLGNDGLARVRPYFESLPRLRHMRITSMAMISDADLVHLEGLTQLDTLELYGVGITESGVDRLRKKLPNVQIRYSGSSLFLPKDHP
jgi:hypothetical protein